MAETIANCFDRLLSGNKTFASSQTADILSGWGKGQSPQILWLGCSDSRIPETTICSCKPGEIFVHRNIANIITAADISANSVIDFSVGNLKVEKIVVCGHTKCGGANAGLGDADLGPTLNTWLTPIRDLRKKNQAELDQLPDNDQKANRLAELNVMLSVEAVKKNPTVIQAIKERGLTVHGVVYDIPAGQIYALDDSGRKAEAVKKA